MRKWSVLLLLTMSAGAPGLSAQETVTDSTSTEDGRHSLVIWAGAGLALEIEDSVTDEGLDVAPAIGTGLLYRRRTEPGWYFGGGIAFLVTPEGDNGTAVFPALMLSGGLNHIGFDVGYMPTGRIFVGLTNPVGLIR